MKGMYYYPDKTKDFGFAGYMAGGFKYYKREQEVRLRLWIETTFLLPSF